MTSRILTTMAALSIALTSGCQDVLSKNDKESIQKKAIDAGRENANAALAGKEGHSKLIGDYIRVSGYSWVVLEGVALATNLDGTGEDPAASPMRAKLLEDMKKHRVHEPNKLLASLDTALVQVRGYLPPLIKKGETFDVDITLPDGTKATSLSGGWVMPADLKEYAFVEGGGTREGKIMAKVKGPILLASSDESVKYQAANLRSGTIPGGATYTMTDTRKLTALTKNEYRSAKLTNRIAERIGQRFHDYDKHGIHQPLAEAKTDSKIELIVPDNYRDNYPRYLQVIGNIALKETPVDRHLRIKSLRDQLMVPETCEQAAMQLEAIGSESLSVLKDGLKSPSSECRFRAAEALAYLGDTAGVQVLKESADKEPAFRVYALVALSTIKDSAAFMALRELVDHDSMETRYGAFRALSEANPNDPMVQGEKFEGGYSLHVLDSSAKPMIHLTRRRKAEITVFGADQVFSTPLVLRAGQKILVKGIAGTNKVSVVRIAAKEGRMEREVSNRVADVIKACAELGAGYPDIVAMLVEAEKHSNLAGRVGIDEMPQAGRAYMREQPGTEKGSETQIGSDRLLPNLFETGSKPAGAMSVEDSVAAELETRQQAEKKSVTTAGADLDAQSEETSRKANK